jgi:uncharacterized membrane protein YgcG
MVDDDQTRQDLYKSTRDDLLKRQLSNTEKFDRAVFALSAVMLGLSLAFIKDIVPIRTAKYLWLLETSWWLFGCSTVLTLFSFVTSQRGITTQLEYAEKYYLQKKDEYKDKRNCFGKVTEYLMYLSCILVVAGIIISIIFVSSNVGGKDMSEEKSVRATGGAVIPSMQKVQSDGIIERGASIPSMQPVPQSQGSSGSGQSSGSNQGGGQSSSSDPSGGPSSSSGQEGSTKQ